MGGSKGGSANDSGMYAALASAQAAQQAYQFGTQQLAWTKQVWNQEQPYVNQVVQGDIATQQQQLAFSKEQQQLYQSTYQPLEQKYTQEAQQWASPDQQKINAAAAQGNVANAAEAQRNSATQQLESFGVNPGSTRFAGLDIGSRTMQAAAEAGAGTQATQATKLQGLGLEAGVVNTGRGLPNTVAGLASTGTGAGTAAAGTSQSNLATGSSAMTAPSNWFNSGAANMNVYTNAVNGYNQAQLGYAQVGAMQSMGMGSLAGGLMGMMLEQGGAVDPALNGRGNTTNDTAIPPRGGGSASATPGGAVPPEASPSDGAATDDVDAKLTANEFVIPKDVAVWKGHEYFAKEIDKARQGAEQLKQRGDIGGRPAIAPRGNPTFISRPGMVQPQVIQAMRTGSPAIPPR